MLVTVELRGEETRQRDVDDATISAPRPLV